MCLRCQVLRLSASTYGQHLLPRWLEHQHQGSVGWQACGSDP
jgi:hypothetical protein